MLCVRDLFNIMTTAEKEEMYQLCYAWRDSEAARIAVDLELTDEEKKLVDNNNLIAAVKLIRNRTGHGLYISKRAIDFYREEMRELQNKY